MLAAEYIGDVQQVLTSLPEPLIMLVAMMDTEKLSTTLTKLKDDAMSSVVELGGNIDALKSARQDANTDDEHDPEGATIAYERAQSDALLRQAQQRVGDILAAQARLEEGTFGICTECGSPIAQARLMARPHSSTCIRCAS